MNFSNIIIQVLSGVNVFKPLFEGPFFEVMNKTYLDPNVLNRRQRHLLIEDLGKRKKKKSHETLTIIPQAYCEGGFKKEKIKTVYPIIVHDIDIKNEKTARMVLNKMLQDEFILKHSLILTPSWSGGGIHLFIYIDDSKNREAAYHWWDNYLQSNYSWKLDPAFLNPVQKATVSADEMTRVNEKAKPFKNPASKKEQSLLKIKFEVEKSGLLFVEDKRHQYLTSFVGKSIATKHSKEDVLQFLNKNLKLSSFDKHLSTFEDLWDRYGEGNSDKKEHFFQKAKRLLFENFSICRDRFNQKIYVNNDPLNNIIINNIRSFFLEQKMNVSNDLLMVLIDNDSVPVRDVSGELVHKYDGVEVKGEFDKLLKSIISKTGDGIWPNYREVALKTWFVSMINQLYTGHPNSIMLSLIGRQNSGKTYFFRHLLPKQFRDRYSENEIADDKDFKILCGLMWLIVDDELTSKSKIDQKAFKKLVTANGSYIRPPYGRVAEKIKRTASFAATGNEVSILRDVSGNRRIIIFLVEAIDHALYNSVDKEKLFVEMYREWENGAPYELTSDQIELLKQINVEFEEVTDVEEYILQTFRKPKNGEEGRWCANSELCDYLQERHERKFNHYHVGRAMQKHNFETKFMTKNLGSKLKCYHVITDLDEVAPIENFFGES